MNDDAFAAAIRDRLTRQPAQAHASYTYEALLAVLDKCEQLRVENDQMPAGVGRYYAHEFEVVIARALGIPPDRRT